MQQKGFTLVELMVVIALIGILLSVATLNWGDMNRKTAIEREAKTVYADLMAVRLDALYTKQARSVVVSGTEFKVYNTNDTSIAPASTKTLAYPLKWTPDSSSLTINFDASGLVESDVPLCVAPDGSLATANPATVDSLVVSAARVKLGKREGGACEVGSIATK
ncbi:prepilin-type N-terminal cleavage/methylation domain-containing protein [Geomonas sp. RF6]|uniref:prepilin-type N-terminal cleavage/methylation domain-containing protein n=1 Tax=Geomonas sp. RF6 TaxID=2897342 RepID=UPI001E537E7D|nr:prepilin-type N-terminal cleavage/methylation domain-containing protein [Geomonas sp. RF6]UFS69639.1 prepilin-type N-terminal cleavage/methylation domain-containing protein [Geomonas sp. RF6]